MPKSRSSLNPKMTTPRDIIVKLLKFKIKKKILKAGRGEAHTTTEK